MTSPTRAYFYPDRYTAAWASDFWAIFRALQEDARERDIPPEDLKDDTLATVAALLIVTNKLDDLWRGDS